MLNKRELSVDLKTKASGKYVCTQELAGLFCSGSQHLETTRAYMALVSKDRRDGGGIHAKPQLSHQRG